jgi:hypothetical protein
MSRLTKHEIGICPVGDLSIAQAECPECAAFIQFEYTMRDGIGEELDADCNHYVGPDEHGDVAVFLSPRLKTLWDTLSPNRAPAHDPLDVGWYQIRDDKQNKGRYMTVRHAGTFKTKHNLRDIRNARMWCVDDVLERSKG